MWLTTRARKISLRRIVHEAVHLHQSSKSQHESIHSSRTDRATHQRAHGSHYAAYATGGPRDQHQLPQCQLSTPRPRRCCPRNGSRTQA